MEGGNPENQEKNPQSKVRPNNKLNPHMTRGPGFEPGPHWWEASALTTAPTLLSLIYAMSCFFLWFKISSFSNLYVSRVCFPTSTRTNFHNGKCEKI